MSNPYTQGVSELEQWEQDHVMLDITTHYPDKENHTVKYKVEFEVSLTEDEAQTMAEDDGNEDDFVDDKVEATRVNIQSTVEDDTFDHFDISSKVKVTCLDG